MLKLNGIVCAYHQRPLLVSSPVDLMTPPPQGIQTLKQCHSQIHEQCYKEDQILFFKHPSSLSTYCVVEFIIAK